MRLHPLPGLQQAGPHLGAPAQELFLVKELGESATTEAPGQALSSQCKAWVSWDGGRGEGGERKGSGGRGGEKPTQQKWWPNLGQAVREGRCEGLGKGVGAPPV